MPTLNPLDRVVLVTLINYSNSKGHTLTAKDIVEIDAINNPSLQVANYEFELFLKEIKVNNVNSMVYLSDLEWSSLLIEGLWSLVEQINKNNHYNLESTVTLQIITSYLVASVEKILTMNLTKNEILKSSPLSILDHIDLIMRGESLILGKFNV